MNVTASIDEQNHGILAGAKADVADKLGGHLA